MHDFHTALPDLQKLDPSKRVNYSFGLVLGVDEFLQEQTHLLEKHRRHNRTLHGFGTVRGLKVSVSSTTPVEIQVAPGLAITPGGSEICVANVMCAKVNDWLKANASTIRDRFGPPPTTVFVCVVLCYRECATDIVPVPGEPCRSESDAMAPSRIADSFELKFCFDDAGSPPFASHPIGSPPGCAPMTARQAGEIEFGRLLQRIEIDGGAASFASAADIAAAARAILTLVPGGGGGPAPTSALSVRPDDAHDTLTTIARIWATEVLPELLRRDNETACCGPSPDRCVLLADVDMDVAADGTVAGGVAGIRVDDTRRPILLATSLLQEWVASGGPAIVP
jgi:hypothetical protein